MKLKIKYGYVLTCCIAGIVALYFIFPAKPFTDPACCIIEDRYGELLGARIATDGQWRFPSSDTVPEKYKAALIAFEDRRFYSHNGIDPIAIFRALRQNIKQNKITEGGSTISMQVIRLMRKGKNRTLKEKIIEAILALRLEMAYSKPEILSFYASNAPFGSNVVGINAAAWRYFGSNVSELSWAEAATLAVLPNAPALIHPGRNRNALKIKRNRLLSNMLQQRIITQEQCELAKLEDLPETPVALPMHAPNVLDKAAKRYPQKRTQTTISSELQKSVNTVITTHAEIFKANNVFNAAAIVADIETGEVLAYVGNIYDINDEVKGSKVDIVTAPRSTGSILKPFLYAAMLDEGELLPNMLKPDIPLHLSGFSPNNFNKTFSGAVPAHYALEQSLNVPTVRMLHDYGVEKFHAMLKDLGMTTLNKPATHYGLSLILGGAEGTLWDITAMYADMARVVNNFGQNSGKYNNYDRRKLNIFTDENADLTKTRYSQTGLINAAALYQTLESLSDVNRPEEEASWKTFSSGKKVAWKTGTSYGNRDAWAVGVTPDFVVGVWVGNAYGEGRPMLTGVGYAAPVLFDIFNLLPRSENWFPRPYDEMIMASICKKSGHKATDLCTETDSIWIAADGLKSEPCPYHILIHLDKTEQYRVNSSCYSTNEMVHKSWFVLPPAQEWYYRQRNADYTILPPLDPHCFLENILPLQIIYPSGGISVMAAKQLDGHDGKIVFKAAHNRPDAVIFWHLDNEYIGQTTKIHEIAYTPHAGTRTLILIDDAGNTVTSKFNVK